MQPMTRQEIQKRMDELARKYVETRDRKIIDALYELGRELEKIEKLEKQ
jgi:predicted transcriptional regulator